MGSSDAGRNRKAVASNPLVQMKIGRRRATALASAAKLIGASLVEHERILIRSDLESLPALMRAGSQASLSLDKRNRILGNLVERGDRLSIGFKGSLRDDQIGELG
jgi:hypothetical protein